MYVHISVYKVLCTIILICTCMPTCIYVHTCTYSCQVRKKAQLVVPVLMEKVGYDSMLKHAGKLKIYMYTTCTYMYVCTHMCTYMYLIIYM